jgi:hypothetical protein
VVLGVGFVVEAVPRLQLDAEDVALEDQRWPLLSP